MFCPQCGAQNADGVTFCGSCGYALNNTPQQSAPAYTQQPFYNAAPEVPAKGISIAAMVLGIVSLVFCCSLYIGLPCAIIGLIMGCIARSKAKAAGMKNNFATAGIVCSSIALALCVLAIVFAAAAASYAYSVFGFI